MSLAGHAFKRIILKAHTPPTATTIAKGISQHVDSLIDPLKDQTMVKDTDGQR